MPKEPLGLEMETYDEVLKYARSVLYNVTQSPKSSGATNSTALTLPSMKVNEAPTTTGEEVDRRSWAGRYNVNVFGFE